MTAYIRVLPFLLMLLFPYSQKLQWIYNKMTDMPFPSGSDFQIHPVNKLFVPRPAHSPFPLPQTEGCHTLLAALSSSCTDDRSAKPCLHSWYTQHPGKLVRMVGYTTCCRCFLQFTQLVSKVGLLAYALLRSCSRLARHVNQARRSSRRMRWRTRLLGAPGRRYYYIGAHLYHRLHLLWTPETVLSAH